MINDCNNGDYRSCRKIARIYEHGSSTKSIEIDDKKANYFYTKAIKILTKGCSNNNYSQCYLLGFNYKNGNGTKIDETKAKNLYTKACDGGYATACNELVRFFKTLAEYAQDGNTSTCNINKALEVKVKACIHGDGRSCRLLGDIYSQENILTAHMNRNSFNVKRDIHKALKFYQKDCEIGHTIEACLNVSNFYLKYDKKEGEEKSFKALHKGCHHKYSIQRECYDLGVAYEKGIGTEQNITKAIQEYRRYCNTFNSKSDLVKCEKIKSLIYKKKR